MTRLRWGLGGALVLVSLWAAVRALTAYVSHGLWLGSGSVLLLAVIAVVGFLSLLQARRRMDVELAGLDAQPPSGELIERRKALLTRLKKDGVALDLDALAATTEAEERGRAYLGRYFVAVTVLVGLVGTFAGLMETLRSMGPLLQSDQVSTLQMLAAPLGGLDVTFGASIVGILVTLALALVQGDLVLAEELAISRLEERTVHVLVPSLWPPTESVGERTLQTLVSLRTDLETLAERAGGRAATQVAGVAKAALADLVAEVAGRFTELEKRLGTQLTDAVQAATQSLERTAQAANQTLKETAQAANTSLKESAQATNTSLQELSRSHADGLSAGEARFFAAAQQHADSVALSAQAVTDGLTQAVQSTMQSLERTAQTTNQTLKETAQSANASLKETAQSANASLKETAQAANASLKETAQSANASLQQSAQGVTDGLAQAVQSTMQSLERTAQTTNASLEELSRSHADGLAASEARFFAAAQQHADSVAVSARTATEGVTQAVQSASQSLEHTAKSTHEAMQESAKSVAQSARDATEGLTQAVQSAAQSLESTHTQVAASLREAVGEAGARLDGSAQALAQAALELRTASESLAPSLDKLAPELSAMTREIALLAARADAGQDPLVADEIVRLGQGVERLEALFKLAQESRA